MHNGVNSFNLKFCYIYTNNASITKKMRFLYINGFILETSYMYGKFDHLSMYIEMSTTQNSLKKCDPWNSTSTPPPLKMFSDADSRNRSGSLFHRSGPTNPKVAAPIALFGTRRCSSRSLGWRKRLPRHFGWISLHRYAGAVPFMHLYTGSLVCMLYDIPLSGNQQGLTLAMCPLARVHFLGCRASSGHNNSVSAGPRGQWLSFRW